MVNIPDSETFIAKYVVDACIEIVDFAVYPQFNKVVVLDKVAPAPAWNNRLQNGANI